MNFLTSILSVTASNVDTIKNVIQIDWLGNIIKWLIEGCQSIGLGIIVFTLILKLITLPFDIISRVSTKKNSVKMEQMRPELEKLQRQYANNKELYQKKLQSLYKENGYSMFSACLPSLLTLVIFIVVIGQFSTYSNYANFGVLCNMSNTYHQTVENYDQNNGTEYIITVESSSSGEDGSVITSKSNYVNVYYIFENEKSDFLKNFANKSEWNVDIKEKYNSLYSLAVNNENIKKLAAETEKGKSLAEYSVGEEGQIKHVEGTDTYELNNSLFTKTEGSTETYMTDEEIMQKLCTQMVEFYAKQNYEEVVLGAAREKAAETFRNTELGFLWVKNIWAQDLPWAHPVKAKFSEYGFVKNSGCIASCSASCKNSDENRVVMDEKVYAEITAGLSKEKSEANGYLILVILSIGTMLVSQLLMQKTNKAQTELSSVDGVDGTAAQSQKMMTWMMPVMFGIFSFMYTASFSLYIVVSSLFSTGSTLLINIIVDKKFAKQAEKEALELEMKRTGRGYKYQQEQESKKKNKKSKK